MVEKEASPRVKHFNLKIAHYILSNEDFSFVLKKQHHTQKSASFLGYYATLHGALKGLLNEFLMDSKNQLAIKNTQDLINALKIAEHNICKGIEDLSAYDVIRMIEADKKALSDTMKKSKKPTEEVEEEELY